MQKTRKHVVFCVKITSLLSKYFSDTRRDVQPVIPANTEDSEAGRRISLQISHQRDDSAARSQVSPEGTPEPLVLAPSSLGSSYLGLQDLPRATKGILTPPLPSPPHTSPPPPFVLPETRARVSLAPSPVT